MPIGYEKPGHVFKLKRSIYGMRQSPLNFYQCLKEGLEARGFQQSKLDPCPFHNGTVICLIYVDDYLFFAKKEEDIDSAIDELCKDEITTDNLLYKRFLLKVESDVAGFLGILFKHDKKKNTIELTQTVLINRILVVTGMEDCSGLVTPAEKMSLGKNENGDPCMEHWSYASVIGMMMYLTSNSRPDISYAVHQCARFTHCTKRPQEVAVKRVVRYLKETRNNGLILRPTGELSIDLYADADFAGLWNSEDHDDPISVKIRTSFIVTLSGVPLLWSSKLQGEIALSKMESKYIALSTGMK